jgi:hypothetical protein
MTTAAELLECMMAAKTRAEKDAVLDAMLKVKVAKRGTPAHGWLLFRDGSAIEMVESQDSDDVAMWEAGWYERNNA